MSPMLRQLLHLILHPRKKSGRAREVRQLAAIVLADLESAQPQVYYCGEFGTLTAMDMQRALIGCIQDRRQAQQVYDYVKLHGTTVFDDAHAYVALKQLEISEKSPKMGQNRPKGEKSLDLG